MKNYNIITYNAKMNIYGNRKNLIVDYEKMVYYSSGINVFNEGIIINNIPIREVNRKERELQKDGFVRLDHRQASKHFLNH